MEQKKNDPKALLMLISSAVLFGTIGVFRRYIPFSSALLACLRGGIGGIALLCFLGVRRGLGKQRINRKAAGALCVTGVFLGLNWILLFEAFRYTSVATATLCYYMEPTIVMLLSPVCFREKLSKRKKLCMIVSVAGMVLVSGVTENSTWNVSEFRGIAFGLGAASLYSAVVILNKKLSGINMYQRTLVELLAASVSLIPYLLVGGEFYALNPESLEFMTVLLVLVVGIVHTGVTYVLYLGSMDGLHAQTIAIFSYLDPVTALLLSVFVLGEQLSLNGFWGAVMIIAAAFCSELKE